MQFLWPKNESETQEEGDGWLVGCGVSLQNMFSCYAERFSLLFNGRCMEY